MSDFSAFGILERGSWSDPTRAIGYVELFASASDQTIESLLDAVGASPQLDALDLCCGQGNVAEALIRRGCNVVASISPLRCWRLRVIAHQVQSLSTEMRSLCLSAMHNLILWFQIWVSATYLISRAPYPKCDEFLRPNGRFAMTVWCGPDVSPCFEIVYDAIKTHGSPDVSVPPGPDFHQFAKWTVAEKLLLEAGFKSIDLEIVDCAWDLKVPEALSEIYERGTVRAAMLLARQPSQNLAAIKSALAEAVRKRFAYGKRWRIPVPAALVSASV